MVINVGYGNFVNERQIISISRVDSAPIKRLVSQSRDLGKVVDVTQGRKTKSVITTSGGYVILSALMPETIASRIKNAGADEIAEEDYE